MDKIVIRLVALPWPAADHPPAALAALAPYLRKAVPHCRVENLYAFLNVMQSIGRRFYDVYARCPLEGDLLYASIFYPQKRREVLKHTRKFLESKGLDSLDPTLLNPGFRGNAVRWDEIVSKLVVTLDAHLKDVARSVAGSDLVGLTTCFNQLFANLCLARHLKEVSPETTVVLGGSTVSGAVGPSILREYPMIDYVVQGEGELPLTALVERIRRSDRSGQEPRGVLSRRNMDENPDGVPLWEVPNLDELPLPDYSGFAELADASNVLWNLPIEGSRGCWWDRIKQTNNPRNACYFCSLNVQWNQYREKTIDRLSREVDYLSDRHGNSVIIFLDNIIRFKGIEELSTALKSHQRDYAIGYEIRPSITPYSLLCLWEAGLRVAEIGIDGLSTQYLRRIGKGITTIQNLQAMKTAYELGIDNQGNLLVGFPGTEQQEVTETCQVIIESALAFQPLNISEFSFGQGSTVDRLKSDFGVANLRNAELLRFGLPEDVYDRLILFDRTADFSAKADWSPLRHVMNQWRRTHQSTDGPRYRRHLLWYADGRSYLRIVDARVGEITVHMLRGIDRDIYMRCMEITDLCELREEYSNANGALDERVASFLKWAGEQHLMFHEDQKYLSLAPAFSPQTAARRIREAHARAELSK